LCFLYYIGISEESYSRMKHIHFVIYRLKSVIIKPLDNVKIQRKTITFTIDSHGRTAFIDKIINSGIMRMFIFYSFYIYIFYFVSQVLCISTDNRCWFSMKNIFFFIIIILFFFYLIIWWGIGIASESKLEVVKYDWFCNYNCFYYFLFFCLIILFSYYSNIPNTWMEIQFMDMCG
jgi:hypothetical protein